MTVLSAAIRGLCLWALMYGLMIHIFVALKWGSGDYLGRYTPILTLNPPLPKHLVEWIVLNTDSAAPDTDEIDRLIDMIKSLPTTEGTVVDKASELLDEQSSELSKLDPAWTNASSPSFLKEGNQTTLSIWRLNNLLTRTSLSSMANDRVDSLLNGTMGDLQEMVNQKEGLKWQTLVGSLSPRTPFPEKDNISEEDLYEELCVLDPIEEIEEDDGDDEDDLIKSSDDVEDEDSEDEDSSGDEEEEEEDTNSTAYYVADGEDGEEIDTSLYAEERDLEKQTMSLRSLLGKRARNLPLYFQESYDLDERLHNATETMEEQFAHARDICETSVQETSDNIAAFEPELPDDAGDNEEECESANEDDVLLLVEAGLDALARREDVRDALLKVLGEIDPEAAKGLILDADLPIDPDIPPPRSVERVPLLRLIDSPIMGQAASFVDSLLDHIGGHYDPLDQYMDQLADQLVDAYNKDASTLGTVFVRYLFVQSGHWKVPMPPILRDFLESSLEGQEWLASLS